MSKIKRIVRYKPPAKKTIIPVTIENKAVAVKPILDENTRRFLGFEKGIGKFPADLTFFQSLRMRMSGENVIEPYRQHVWVHVAVNTIAQSIASIPFKLARGEVKSPKIIESGPIYNLFMNPNPHMSRHQLWEATMIYLELEGECMWLLERPKGAENKYNILPTEIWPVSGKNFNPVIENNVFVGWKYQPMGSAKEEYLTLAQVIQFKYFNPYNYYRGLSPISAAKMSIDQDWNAAKYNLAFFENSADPGGVLTYKGNTGLNDDQRKAIREGWEDRHKGPKNTRRVALLEGGMEYQQTQVSHTDMLFLEGRKYNRDEIFAIYKLPKFEDLNFATAKVNERSFWQKTLIPKTNYLMDILEAKVFKFIEGGEVWGYFDTSVIEALQEDFNAKVETGYKLWQMGYPINKVNKRLEMNLEPVPWGDEIFVPFSMTPITSLMGGEGKPPEETTPPAPVQESARKLLPAKSTLKMDRDKYWNGYVKMILDPNEKKFQSKIKRYVFELRSEQLKRLESGKTAEQRTAVTKLDSFELDQVLFAQQEWDKKLKALTRPLYETIMTMAGEQLSEEMGGLFQFNLTDPKMLAFLNEKLIKVTDINDTIRGNLRESLMEGINAKETIGELQDRVRTVFNFTSNRSLTIARTETAQTASGTRFLVMKQEGVEYQEWLSARDELVRTTPYNHAIDGEVVAVGDRFSNGLRYASDVDGAPGNVINCFIEGRTKVFTDKGFKSIAHIKSGDSVLTHNGRFKNVTRIFKGRLKIGSEVVRIILPKRHGRCRKGVITTTPEHRFLTQRGWVEAKDLMQTDKLMIMAGFCGHCGKKIPYYRKFCSKLCWSRKTVTEQWKNPKHREIISQKASIQLKKEYANGTRDRNEITKVARKKCFEIYGDGGYLKYDPSVHEKGKQAIISKYGSTLNMLKQKAFSALGKAGWYGSSLDRAMQRFLDNNGRKYIQQHWVGRRRVDFYLPDEKMFIECDSQAYHNDAQKERRRDLEILLQHPDHQMAHCNYGGKKPRWEFFDLKALNHSGTYEFTEIDIKKIEKYQIRKTMPLYNFAVQDDESYLVYGIVSHNCRCLCTFSRAPKE